MNKEILIKKIELLKKSEEALKNAVEEYIIGFGHGNNQAIDKVIELLKNDEEV